MNKTKNQVLPTIQKKDERQKRDEGRKTGAQMLAEYKIKQHTGHTRQESKQLELRRLLAARSAHLPGYSWCQDWVQWMRNNHPLLALCCKYKENPVGIGNRIVILLGSISFGLAATNFIYLFYQIYEDANGIVFTIKTGEDMGSPTYFSLTYEMVMVWTLGSCLHSLLDLCVWHLTACACCMPGACLSCLGFLRTLGPLLTIALSATFVVSGVVSVVIRANYDAGEGDGTSLNGLAGLKVEVESLSFLMGYFVELSLVYFLYYPIMATVFFSGAIWSIFPCIGGRPKEIERQLNEKKKMEEMKDVFDDTPVV